ncbi:MAG: cytochrome b/b6 domain-containing protein [Desulfovibrionaceae bacterium]
MLLIRRHTTIALFLHWFNAACWVFLLASGFALLDNPETQPVGAWWPALWGEAPILHLHQSIGVLWAAVCGIGALYAARTVSLPFLREIFRLSPAQDALWCWRKALTLILGPTLLRRLHISGELPPQGFYNAGQKYVAILAVSASVILILSGIVLLCSPAIEESSWIQWAILVHFIAAGCMGVALPVHIYMAALAPGEKPALLSMVHGFVPENFIRHHNPLWYAELKRDGRIN